MVKKIIKNNLKIGIFSPANPMSRIDKKFIDFGIKKLETLGFSLLFSKNCYLDGKFTAGTVEQRVEDLEELFENKEVSFLMSSYGGYNSNQLLEKLNYSLIKNNPKPIIGYSDATALLNGIYAKTNVKMLHGPSFITFCNPTIFDEFTNNFLITLFSEGKNITLCSPHKFASDDWHLLEDFKKREINFHPGWFLLKGTKTSGVLVGGNLETLITLIGTSYAPKFKNKILLLESLENNPARFIRSLTHLKQAGILKVIRGLIIGQFPKSSCLSNINLLKSIILFCTKEEDYPILLNANFSHVDPIYTLPIGGEVSINLFPEPNVQFSLA